MQFIKMKRYVHGLEQDPNKLLQIIFTISSEIIRDIILALLIFDI